MPVADQRDLGLGGQVWLVAGLVDLWLGLYVCLFVCLFFFYCLPHFSGQQVALSFLILSGQNSGIPGHS